MPRVLVGLTKHIASSALVPTDFYCGFPAVTEVGITIQCAARNGASIAANGLELSCDVFDYVRTCV